jgi:hypothetical protein
MKIGPVAALILSGIALCLLVLAPLGWRLGLWRYGIGLYWMMPVSGFVAAVAVILSVLTLARDWSQLRLRDWAMLFIAFALGAALVYVPGQYWYTRCTVPPIHDITTDTDNPPTFSAVLAARAAEYRASQINSRLIQTLEILSPAGHRRTSCPLCAPKRTST